MLSKIILSGISSCTEEKVSLNLSTPLQIVYCHQLFPASFLLNLYCVGNSFMIIRAGLLD
jgi:hypothetical protein